MPWLPDNAKEFQQLVWDVDGYVPSEEQRAIHEDRHSIRMVAGGIQGGKSKFTAREGDKYTTIEDGLGWIIGPDYTQARIEWDYLAGVYGRMGILDTSPGMWSRPANGSCVFTTTWGFQWVTKSSDDEVKLASRAPDVILFVEAAQSTESAFYKVVERATRQNADIIASGTFETSLGWYKKRWMRYQGPNREDGRSFSLPSWSNLAMFPGGRNDPKILKAEARMPPDLFMERYGGMPHTPYGVVFPEFKRSFHVGRFDWDPNLPTEITVDPAMHCYPILFLQEKGNQVRVASELYLRNVIAQVAIGKFLAHPFSEAVRFGAMDIAGAQHHANYSQLEVWEEELRKAGRAPIQFMQRKIFEKDWRDAISLRLHGTTEDGEPLLLLHESLGDDVRGDGRSMGLIAEFETYRWPQKNEKASEANRPLKFNEDGLSALGYWLVLKYGTLLERESFDDLVVPTYSLGWAVVPIIAIDLPLAIRAAIGLLCAGYIVGTQLQGFLRRSSLRARWERCGLRGRLRRFLGRNSSTCPSVERAAP